MTADPAHLEHARKVADAVLYEGYLLYPYRRSSQKNRTRFQFGVLMPPPYRAVDDVRAVGQPDRMPRSSAATRPGSTSACASCTCSTGPRSAIDPATGAASDVDAVLVDGTEYGSFDEAVEREQQLSGRDRRPARCGYGTAVSTSARRRSAEELTGPGGGAGPGGWSAAGRRSTGHSCVRAERAAGPYGVLRLRVRVENRTEPRGPAAQPG